MINDDDTDPGWRNSFAAHDEQFDKVTAAEMAAVIRTRMAEVKELAGQLEELVGSQYDGHVLANLNSARLHLSDIHGC